MDFSKLNSIVNDVAKIMDKDNWRSKKINYLAKVKEDNPEVVKQFSSIFTVLSQSEFGPKEMERLRYMLVMAEKVKDNELQEHDASVAVGQRLVDEIVKPQIGKK